MHIKKLEISGFKSFVDKTVVHFDHDVIGVVGPNGCGKSNIVDAIRWCMGEQSAKHLRGRAMEDVIFNGSESRPQHGMAEVTLTFNNNDETYAQSLPETYRAYPEIAVTRRLYRDGTSEYLINKTAVRLRDITDLFLGTGVGTKAYSIVEQGRIGQIVSSRPQDRRMYIEEAAGITKYRLRRKQAERKMDLTRTNLLRINDIVSEIDRTRGSLKRQAAKAERYVQYRGELEDLFLHDASHRLLEMIVMEKMQSQLLATQEARAQEVESRIGDQEGRLSAARQEASSIETRYDSATAAYTASEQRMTQLAADFDRSKDRLGHLNERLAQGKTEQAELTLKLEQLGAEDQELQERITLLSKDETSRDQDAAEEAEQLSELRAGETASERAVSELQTVLAALRTEQATTRARQEASVQQSKETEARRAKLEEERCQLATEIERLKLNQQALAAALEELREHQAGAVDESQQLEQELLTLKATKKTQETALGQVRQELSLKRSRLAALQDLHERLEGVGAGTKALLSAKDPLVLGMLADRVSVNEAYTDAFAGLLGDRLQTVIVQDPERGLELLDELRTSKRGRATIAAQRPSFIEGRSGAAEADPLVLGELADQLNYAPEDEALIRSLVGGAVVVNTPADALKVNARYAGVTAVALDGTVVSDQGLVSGGSGDHVAAAMVEQKREIKQLTELLSELTLESGQQEAEYEAVIERLAELELLVTACRQARHERELKLLTAEKDLSGADNTLEQKRQRYERVAGETEELKARLETLQQATEQNSLQLTSLAENESEAQVAFESAQAESLSWKERTATKAAAVTERKVRLAQVREQLDAARTAAARVQAGTEEAQARVEKLEVDMTHAASTLGEVAAQLMLTKEARGVAEIKAGETQKELEEVRHLLDQVRGGLGRHEGELREFRVELAELSEQVRDQQMKLQKLAIEREHLVHGVAERFRGLDLPRVVGDYHARPAPDAEHRRRIDELSKLIDRMGPVNLDAKTEYDDAELRFTELNDQKVDIEVALEELERAIKHMDRESKRRFRETYDAVNALFKATFTRLFKGGTASLKMTDPDDILETGVDIIAQPPGKKLGNIELMSGGEKALTATALIFAIFQHRPSPFCVLDEVDAPLDEANVSRYNEAIRSMTANSQFIIITHIKQTMQAVDVLYGVTMGEPGVSRLVSVKVNEKASSRSERAPSAISEAPMSGASAAQDASAVAQDASAVA